MAMTSEATIEMQGVHRLRPGDKSYPARVLEVPGRPRILRALGNMDVLTSGPILAVVGVRDMTPEIAQSTRRVVEAAAEFGMVILSGMSPGVDVAAHEAAIELGLKTVAVPGAGLEAILESDRGPLSERIAASGGLIVSPFPSASPETPERRWWRNRIIAALCHGLVVVASEPGGGELEAQRWARQLERRLILPDEDL
jgi:DNA processing protein